MNTRMANSDAKAAKPWMSSGSGGRRAWIAFPWVGIAPLLLAACSGGPGAPEVTGATSAAIYGGVVDDDAQANATVVA
ncbi:MAG: hypothetical protein ACRELB_12500, partial [Polyangiaceae bacterium]